MTEAIVLGALFGVGAALSVGPIFVTIVHESLTGGLAAGLRVILGSASADVLLMLPALLAAWLIASVDAAANVIAFVGAAYFAYLAFVAARDSRRLWRDPTQAPVSSSGGWSFAKGVLGNLLNPLAWAFWLATGTPTMLRVNQSAGLPGLVLFAVTWFAVAIVIEVGIAALVAHSRKAVTGRSLACVQAASAGTFVVVAAALVLGRVR